MRKKSEELESTASARKSTANAEVERVTTQGLPQRTDASRGGRKLSAVGRVFAVQCINEGMTNRQIDGALRREGYLREDDRLSDETYRVLRGRPECQADLSRLSDEAQVAGDAAVSRAIVTMVELRDAAAEQLISADGTLRDLDPRKLAALVKSVDMASRFLLSTFAPGLRDTVQATWNQKIAERATPANNDAAVAQAIDMIGGVVIDMLGAAKAREAARELPTTAGSSDIASNE